MFDPGRSDVLMRIASWKNPANWSRNLHTLISRWSLSLPVTVSHVLCPCLFRSTTSMVPWPILLLSDWLPVIFKRTGGSLLLNGFTLDDAQHELQLSSFWELYKTVRPSHRVYTAHAQQLHRVIPMYYHGDEGRGKLKRPILVTSFVAGLPARGHTFLSRFLAAVFPGERYSVGPDGVETLEALHGILSKDLTKLFYDGFEVMCLNSWMSVWSHSFALQYMSKTHSLSNSCMWWVMCICAAFVLFVCFS